MTDIEESGQAGVSFTPEMERAGTRIVRGYTPETGDSPTETAIAVFEAMLDAAPPEVRKAFAALLSSAAVRHCGL